MENGDLWEGVSSLLTSVHGVIDNFNKIFGKMFVPMQAGASGLFTLTC
jgi:hypothetical protein